MKNKQVVVIYILSYFLRAVEMRLLFLIPMNESSGLILFLFLSLMCRFSCLGLVICQRRVGLKWLSTQLTRFGANETEKKVG